MVIPSLNRSSFLKYLHLDIVFKTCHTLDRFIKDSKDKTDKKYQSGVYSLSWVMFNKEYPTGRTFANMLMNIKDFFLIFLILYDQNKGLSLNYLKTLKINQLYFENISQSEEVTVLMKHVTYLI